MFTIGAIEVLFGEFIEIILRDFGRRQGVSTHAWHRLSRGDVTQPAAKRAKFLNVGAPLGAIDRG
jgi:hypothetical protein